MHLRTLVIHGFKSFSQRTQLDFEPGITAVVGPNGSGKSNLSDAFRWVLGEQSLRALRGRKTEDVLFAGASGRPPAGMAEVQLTFDTAGLNGRVLSLPYTELSIVRRAYRSGENEYYVNRERSRLRDVVDLLGRIGLGLDGFGLVGQGAMDAALSLRAEDRRALIEQAAAIGHLHTRLDDARERLEQTRANLGRIADLIAEVSPQRDLLERQAAKVRERAKLTEELEAGLLRWYAHLLVAPRRRAQQADQARERIRGQQQAMERRRQDSTGELARARQATAGTTQELTTARVASEAAQDEARKLAQRIALAEERERGLRRRCDEASEQLADLRRDLASEEGSIGGLSAQRDALLSQVNVIEAELAVLEAEATVWEEERKRKEGELRHARRRLADLEAGRAATNSRRQAAEERLQHLEATRQERQNKHDELARERATRETRLADSRQPAAQAREILADLVAVRATRLAEVEATKDRSQDLSRQITIFEKEIASVRARVEALRSVEEAGTGYFAGVRAILQASRGQKARLSGIVGVVARLVTTAREHEVALETALGGHAQDIVVERWADAEAAVAHLKSSGAGRATFLPMDTLRPPHRQAGPNGDGVIGVAADLVQIDPNYRLIANFLLGQTLIVESLAVARRVLRECPPSWQIVTLDGDLSRSSGVVTGGAPATNRGSLGRHREQREAQATLNSLLTKREEVARQVAAEREAETAATGRLNESQRQVRAAEERVRQAEVAENEAQRQFDRASQNLAWHVDELRRLDEQQESARKAVAAAHASEAAAVREHEAAAAQVVGLEAALAEIRPPRDVLAAVYDKRGQRDLGLERARAIEVARKRQEGRVTSLLDQIRTMETRLREIAAERARLEAERADLAASHERRQSVVAERTKQVDALKAELIKLEDWQRRSEAAAREVDAEARKLEAEIRDTETAADRAAVELAGVNEQIRADLGELDDAALAAGMLRVTRGDAVQETPIVAVDNPHATRDRLHTLRNRIQQLPNDPAILDEFDAACERLRFLNEQLADLGRTAATLTEAIEETGAAMRARFGETFGAVSAAFERRFVELFGGGTARLSLDGEDDLPGVEIYAQPPGKRSQSLAMLSGGERALTAAALLFSLIETNPPPFCVLDEVDAALDENNVSRFCSALRGLSERTQFIVITHNRRTMEAAGAIYGLTLENRGESRILSLKLHAAAST